MAKGTASTASAETVGIISSDDYIEGNPQTFKSAHVAPFGAPANFIKIASQVTTIDRDYPYDGDGLLDTVTSATIVQLDNVTAGLPANAEGLLLHMISGTAGNIGETRRIITHGASRTMTLNRALPNTPSTGDGYLLLVELFRLSELLVKTEYSASGATCDFVVALYDYARTLAASPAFRKAIRFMDVSRTPDNVGAQGVGTEETNYYHGRLISTQTRASLGAKIRLTAISSGNVSLWACGV